MFNWTTTTIINSLTDYKSDLPLIKVWNGAETLEGQELPSGFSGVGKIIKIKRDHTFEARYISSVYKATANNPVLCEMEIDCAAIVTALKKELEKHPVHGRLSFYVALEGSEESIYANDWYQKGKPFSVGFELSDGEEGSDLASLIEKNANKFGVVMYGKKIFDLKADGAKLKLKGTHEYQRIKMAAVTIDHHIDEKIVDFYEDGVDNIEEGQLSKKGVFKSVKRGINGFGTYHQLIKDLRLPTVHHNKWLQIQEDEKPVVGAKYNQYIITYCAPSMANPGFTVIGQHNMSVTTHVFWVNQAVAEEFENYLKDADITPAEVNKVTTKNAKEVTIKIGGEDTVEPGDAMRKTADAGTKYSVNHEQKVVHSEAEETAKVSNKKA